MISVIVHFSGSESWLILAKMSSKQVNSPSFINTLNISSWTFNVLTSTAKKVGGVLKPPQPHPLHGPWFNYKESSAKARFKISGSLAWTVFGFMGIEMITLEEESLSKANSTSHRYERFVVEKGYGKKILLIFRLFKKVKRYQCRNVVVRVGFLDRKPRWTLRKQRVIIEYTYLRPNIRKNSVGGCGWSAGLTISTKRGLQPLERKFYNKWANPRVMIGRAMVGKSTGHGNDVWWPNLFSLSYARVFSAKKLQRKWTSKLSMLKTQCRNGYWIK